MALLLLTSPPLGHVAMSFKPGQIGPIRNAGGPAATYNDNGVDGGIPAPNAIVDGGYDITCNLPPQNNAAPLECTVALIDQRDWGGCVDISLNAAGVPEPPSPPPAPIVPNAGAYRMLATNSIDTSAADFTCCPLA